MSSKLLTDEPPLLLQPNLAARIGLNEAIFLQQLHYWLEQKPNSNKKDGCSWVHNTYGQWQKQFPFWGERTIRRIVMNLEKLEILKSRVTTNQFRKTKFYTIDYSSLKPLKSNRPVETNASGHHGHTESPVLVDGSVQPDPFNQAKVTRSYNPYTETTPENTLHPPLTPPSGELCLRQEDEEDLMKMMLDIWDETVYQILNPGKGLRLTKDRRVQMKKLLTGLLDGKVELWEEYCQLIANCPFLMGQNARKFKVNLDWALNPKNALKVLENDFYSPPPSNPEPPKEAPWDEYETTLRNELKHWPYQAEWLLICEALVKCVGQITFATWLQQLRPKEVSAERVVLLSLNSFTRDYILREYGEALKTCVSAIYPQNPLIEIEVNPGLILNEANTPHTTKGDIHE